MAPIRKKSKNPPVEDGLVVKVNDVSEYMFAKKSISISTLPNWLLQPNPVDSSKNLTSDGEFSIETSYLHKTESSKPVIEDDFGLKILHTFSLANESECKIDEFQQEDDLAFPGFEE